MRISHYTLRVPLSVRSALQACDVGASGQITLERFLLASQMAPLKERLISWSETDKIKLFSAACGTKGRALAIADFVEFVTPSHDHGWGGSPLRNGVGGRLTLAEQRRATESPSTRERERERLSSSLPPPRVTHTPHSPFAFTAGGNSEKSASN